MQQCNMFQYTNDSVIVPFLNIVKLLQIFVDNCAVSTADKPGTVMSFSVREYNDQRRIVEVEARVEDSLLRLVGYGDRYFVDNLNSFLKDKRIVKNEVK